MGAECFFKAKSDIRDLVEYRGIEDFFMGKGDIGRFVVLSRGSSDV